MIKETDFDRTLVSFEIESTNELVTFSPDDLNHYEELLNFNKSQ